MQKILIVCGPTAVGKTKLALELAETLHGEIISADSRQLYKGLPTLTGKDIPDSAVLLTSDVVVGGKCVPYWQTGKTRVWGMDFLELADESHSSLYALLGTSVLANIFSRRKLPIIAGGTGMYIEALLGKYDTVHVPRNDDLRPLLESMSVEQLQERLMDLDLVRIGAMNQSDKQNKRRLMRAIEIAVWRQNHETPLVVAKQHDVLWMGLYAIKRTVDDRIGARVTARWQEAVEEVERLKTDPSIFLSQHVETILGLREIHAYLSGELSEQKAKDQWIRNESQYAKRQMVWFRKNPDIDWYDVADAGWRPRVEERVGAWYT